MKHVVLTKEELASLGPKETAEFHEAMDRLRRKKEHQLLRESCAYQKLNHLEHVLRFEDRYWTSHHRKSLCVFSLSDCFCMLSHS